MASVKPLHTKSRLNLNIDKNSTAYEFEELKALDELIPINLLRDVPLIELPYINIGPFDNMDTNVQVPLWMAEHLIKIGFATLKTSEMPSVTGLRTQAKAIEPIRKSNEEDDPLLILSIPPLPTPGSFFVMRRLAKLRDDSQMLATLDQYQAKRKVRIDCLIDEIVKNMKKKLSLPHLTLINLTSDEIIYLWQTIARVWQEYSYIYATVDLPIKVHAASELVLSDADFISESQNTSSQGVMTHLPTSETSETLHTANMSDLLGNDIMTSGFFSIDDSVGE